MAANLFTDGGDHNWNTAGNWSDGVPTSDDTVTVAAGTTSLIINATAVCASFDMTGTAGITISGSSQLTVSGNFTLDANCTWTHSGAIIINGAGTITSAGKSMSSITSMRITGASIALASSNALNIGTKPLYVNAASTTFTTNNNTITCGVFGDNTVSGAITLALGTSTINCTSVVFGTCTLTKSTATETINITHSAMTTDKWNTASWGTVNITTTNTGAAVLTQTGAATFNQFNVTQNSDRSDTYIAFTNDITINDSSSWIGGGTDQNDPTYRPLFCSSTDGSARTITVGAASKTLTFTDVDMMDIVVATTNSPTVTGTRVGDCGGNTNAGVSTPKTVYVDYGTTSTGYTTGCWSTSSGGGSPSTTNFPLPQDTGVIDNNSFDTTGRVFALNAVRMGNIDASGLTESQQFTIGAGTYYGDVNLSGSGCATIGFASAGVNAIFDARRATTLTITLTDTNLGQGSLTVTSNGGTVQLGSDVIITSDKTFTLTKGTLDLNGKTITCGTFSSSNTNTRTLQDAAGGGKIVIIGLTGTKFDLTTGTSLTISNAPDITIGDSASPLTYTGDVTAILNSGYTFGDLTICDHAGDYSVLIQETA